jgi:hypothetical protein
MDPGRRTLNAHAAHLQFLELFDHVDQLLRLLDRNKMRRRERND